MGSIFKGSWEILSPLSLDYILNIPPDCGSLDVRIEDVWVDLSQALRILAEDGRSMTSINRIWTVNSNAYCPILDFIHKTAQKSSKKSELFKVRTYTSFYKLLFKTRYFYVE